MTTSITPTHGDPLRHEPLDLGDLDTERWLPDPSWPVPPRGWQLWAAAGPAGRAGSRRHDDASFPQIDADVHDTGAVKSDLSGFVALEDASFTLPTRPGLDPRETVDLLAGEPRRSAPDGAVPGFAVLGALVLFSILIGGVTGGLVVVGVSTLLAAVAALVRGRLTLTQVGGQKGAGWLLGAAVTALIVGSVATHERGTGVVPQPGAPVPVSSPLPTETQTSYAAVPPSGVGATTASGGPSTTASSTTATSATRSATRTSTGRTVVPSTQAPVVASGKASGSTSTGGLTLSPDALDPKPSGAAAATSPDVPPAATGKGNGGKDAKDGKAAKDQAAKDNAAKDKAAKDKAAKDGKAAKGKASKDKAAKDKASKDKAAKDKAAKAAAKAAAKTAAGPGAVPAATLLPASTTSGAGSSSATQLSVDRGTPAPKHAKGEDAKTVTTR